VHDALLRLEVDGEVGQAEKRVCINPHAARVYACARGIASLRATARSRGGSSTRSAERRRAPR
jgi:hypothetical protein